MKKDMQAGLMTIASHQTFSNQIKHLYGQIKFGHTFLLNWILASEGAKWYDPPGSKAYGK